MKKMAKLLPAIITIVLLFSLSFFLFACGSALNPFSPEEMISMDQGEATAVSTGRTWEGSTQVILQAFHWNLVKTQGDGLASNWYQTISNMADDIKNVGFTIVWMPPPWDDDSEWYGNGVHGGGEGYFWHDFDLNSRYGSATDLSNAASALSNQGLSIIYDIVANHRDRNRMSNDVWSYPGSQWRYGGSDDGDPFMSGDCDLNTADSTVYNRIKNALLDLKNNYSADGFRWDFVRGYAASRVDAWMDAVFGDGQGFSVGELWKDPIGDDPLITWSNGADSPVFDFSLKKQLNAGNYGGLCSNDSASVRARAVTFVDNHDTGYSPDCDANDWGQHHWPFSGDKGKAYAYILSMPGTPCVYWPDVFDWGMKDMITALISARKTAGVTASSSISWQSGSGKVAAIINDNLAIKIDHDWSGPGSGWTSVWSGSGWEVWLKDQGSGGWDNCYFRGTPNSWGATEMTKTGDHTWETVQTFTGVTNPRFKVDRYADWTENYPSQDYTVTDDHEYKIVFDDSDHSFTVTDLGSVGSTTTSTTTTTLSSDTITLKMTKDVGSGYGLYFTGSCAELTNWGGGVRGEWTTGNVWEVTIPNPGNFEWKVRKGPYDGIGVNWESGSNHNQDNLWPTFNGGF